MRVVAERHRWPTVWMELWMQIAARLRAHIDRQDIMQWNDVTGRKHGEVLAVVDQALAATA